ncbi:MAG: hypothetical protein ABI920_03170 [Casimicrobiaceae bacterium]
MLAWIGRYGPQCMAAGVVIGLVAPPLAATMRPLLIPSLLVPLVFALVRLDWSAVGAYRQQRARVGWLLGWLLLASPLAVFAVSAGLVALGMPVALQQAVVLMAASSPIVSSVAIALMLGLDPVLALVAVLGATALVPFSLPLLASALLGFGLEIALPEFIARLAALVGGAFAAAWALRRWTPLGRRDAIAVLDAVTVLSLVIFAIAIMDGVGAFARARPGYATLAVLLAFAGNLLLQAAGYAAFRRLGRRAALTVGLVSGNCNMGLILVALEGRGSLDVTVFFALAQLPMYLLPALLQPVYRRALARHPS